MLIGLKIILLLLAVNAAPPLIALLLKERWNRPIDGNRMFADGKPFMGSHKTIRGVVGSVATGTLFSLFLGFPLVFGFCVGFFSMTGDLVSSFLKRRFDIASGTAVFILDQIFEGLLPLVFVKRYFSLDWVFVTVLLVLFIPITHLGAILFKKEILPVPGNRYPCLIRSRTRFKAWRACHIALPPLQRCFNLENILYHEWMMAGAFKLLRQYEKGVRNALDIRFRQIELEFSDIPPMFDSYRILFLSDLHLDGLPGLTERIVDIVSDIECDICIIGGDIRAEMYGSSFLAVSRLRQVISKIRTKDGVFGVLGNHDCIEAIPDFEDAGICMLVNDAHALERDGDTVWLVGVDDPHYYRTHDLKLAFSQVPEDAFKIFIAHSPEVYKEAAQHMARLYLCGHTHGGQVRVSFWDGPIITHSRAPRKTASGLWKHKDMYGYTSSGVGTSGVHVRFNCPGEIVLLTLKKCDDSPKGFNKCG